MKMLRIITLFTIAVSGPQLLADEEAAEMAGARAEREAFAEREPGVPEREQVRMTGEGHEFVAEGETSKKLNRFRRLRASGLGVSQTAVHDIGPAPTSAAPAPREVAPPSVQELAAQKQTVKSAARGASQGWHEQGVGYNKEGAPNAEWEAMQKGANKERTGRNAPQFERNPIQERAIQAERAAPKGIASDMQQRSGASKAMQVKNPSVRSNVPHSMHF